MLQVAESCCCGAENTDWKPVLLDRLIEVTPSTLSPVWTTLPLALTSLGDKMCRLLWCSISMTRRIWGGQLDLNSTIYLLFGVINIHYQSSGNGGTKWHWFCFMMVINDDPSAYFSYSYRPELLMIKSVNSHSIPLLISWIQIKSNINVRPT